MELCSSIKNSDEKSDSFYKNSFETIPNPSLVFGSATNPVVFTYAEFYNLDKEATYLVKTRIVDASSKTVKETSRTRKFGIVNAVDVGTLTVTSFASGKYRLQTMLTDGKENEYARSEKVFFVYNPHIKVEQASAASMKAGELAGLSAAELADEFRKAQYLATDQEVKTFAEIQSEEGRREFLARFWTDAEPGRFGRNPIKRSEYLERVKAADVRFRVMATDGWRTDRGRVSILYGEPDEIERQPSSQGSKPYEIWHFYQIENGVMFAFVDRSGFNDYILVHSTKRGELRDDSWQRFLR
jgi:GWxTD domain-containing protein